jgi:hypothetical protein
VAFIMTTAARMRRVAVADFLAVDTQMLRANADHFEHVHVMAMRAYNRLHDTLGQLDPKLDHDKFGHDLSVKYTPSAKSQQEGILSLSEVFGTIADAVRVAADNYDRAQREADGG